MMEDDFRPVVEWSADGVSRLRDQFAMAALPWTLELNKDVAKTVSEHCVVTGAAKDAYEIAEAMLAARGGK